MPLSAYQLAVRSNPEVDFLEALATNEASADVELRFPTREPHYFIRAVSIVSLENLAWEVQLFSKAVNSGATFATDQFNAVWQFGPLLAGPPASPGYPYTPVGGTLSPFYHQYVDGNWMPYVDMDQVLRSNPNANVPLGQGSSNAEPRNARLHCRLINRSAGAKTAGALGALQVTFWCALQGQQV